MKILLTITILSWFLSRTLSHRTDLSSANTHPITTHWDSTKNWKLYQLSNFKHVFNIPADSLQYLKGKPLSDDSMHLFLSNTKKLEGINPMWQGCYLASYQTEDGQTRKVIISHYAGFLFSQSEKAYYQVDPSMQRDWLEYLSDLYVDIDAKGK